MEKLLDPKKSGVYLAASRIVNDVVGWNSEDEFAYANPYVMGLRRKIINHLQLAVEECEEGTRVSYILPRED